VRTITSVCISIDTRRTTHAEQRICTVFSSSITRTQLTLRGSPAGGRRGRSSRPSPGPPWRRNALQYIQYIQYMWLHTVHTLHTVYTVHTHHVKTGRKKTNRHTNIHTHIRPSSILFSPIGQGFWVLEVLPAGQ
jgi:hypothetical protein